MSCLSAQLSCASRNWHSGHTTCYLGKLPGTSRGELPGTSEECEGRLSGNLYFKKWHIKEGYLKMVLQKSIHPKISHGT